MSGVASAKPDFLLQLRLAGHPRTIVAKQRRLPADALAKASEAKPTACAVRAGFRFISDSIVKEPESIRPASLRAEATQSIARHRAPRKKAVLLRSLRASHDITSRHAFAFSRHVAPEVCE
jgi:hypothetical protein